MKNLISELYTQVKQTTNIKWFQPSFFKYFVVINTKNGQDKNLSNETNFFFEELNVIHGEKSCFWLDIEMNKDFNFVDLVSQQQQSQINHQNNHNDQFNQSNLIAQINLSNDEKTNDLFDESNQNNNNIDINKTNNSSFDDPLSPLNSMGDLKLNNENDSYFDDLENSKKTKTKIIYNESLMLKIDTLLKELLIKALIPWSEKQIKLLNDAISLRKGFRKSIFSATKQFLQMSSSTVNLRGIVQQSNNITYCSESNEMQNRKLGL